MAYNDDKEKGGNRTLSAIAKTAQTSLNSYISATMETKECREYFYWLLGVCKIGYQPFTANNLTTSFNCGEYNIGLQVQAHILENAPAYYLQMLQEKQEERLNVNRTD